MRLNEICQLDVTDIQNVEGVACFSINDGAKQNDRDKRLKTVSSERLIPIHPTLLAIGFMGFVSERRAARSCFTNCPPVKGGLLFRQLLEMVCPFPPEGWSRTLQDVLPFVSALLPRRSSRGANRLSGWVALGGWTSGSGQDGGEVSAAYGSGYRVATLFETISRVEYPALDLSHFDPI